MIFKLHELFEKIVGNETSCPVRNRKKHHGAEEVAEANKPAFKARLMATSRQIKDVLEKANKEGGQR